MFNRNWNPWRTFVRRNLSRKRRLQPASAQLSMETLELRTLMTANPVGAPTEYFVAPGGDDWNAGTVAQPFATIRRALDASHPGDTITLRNGTYEGGLNIDVSDLTIRSMPGEWAVIESPVTTQWGDGHSDSVIRYGFDVNGGKLQNLEISGGYWYGVMFWDWWDSDWSQGSTHVGASNITIEGCKIHDTGIDAVKITPGADNITLLNNEIYNAGRRSKQSADGIDNNNGDHMLARGNYIHDVPGIGVLTTGGTVGSVVEQNLVKDVGGAGITVGFYSEAEWMEPATNPNYYTSIDTVARNNIVVNPGMAGVGVYASLNPQVYNNTLINPATEAQAPIQLGGIELWIDDVDWNHHVASVDPKIQNNLITVADGNNTRMVDIRYQSYTGQLTLDHNLFYSEALYAPKFINRNVLGDAAPERFLSSWKSAEGFDTHSIVGDPKLDGGFHLTPGSAAIAQGIPLAGLTNDYDGNLRLVDPPNPDLGADEFDAGANLLTPPAAFGAPSLTIASAAYHNWEGQSIDVQVVRQGLLNDTVTVQYGTMDGSAKGGQDYAAVAGTLTFAPGEKTKTVTVSLLQNSTAEGDRHFLFALSNPTTNGQLPVRLDYRHAASMTIDDDEVAVTLNYRTLFVATDGSDVTGDGSEANPWKSLQFAADNVGPGDYVIVKPGLYDGAYITADGKSDARIVFHAQPGVEINDPDPVVHKDGLNLEGADYVTVEGFYIHDMPRAGIRSVLNTGAEIRGNTVDHNGFWGVLTGWSEKILVENNVATNSVKEHGIYISNSSDDGIIRNNLVFGNRCSGIQFNADGGLPGDGVHSRNIIEGNLLYNNGSGGGGTINLDGFQDGVVRNNLLYGNHNTGIVVYVAYGAQSSTNNIVANNTVVMAADSRWAMLLWNGSEGTQLVNNVLLTENPNTGSLNVESGSEPAFSDHNVLENLFQINGANTSFAAWQQFLPGMDSNSLFATANDLFVNPSAGDFRLKVGSPAIDAGQFMLAPSVDLFQHARPQGAGIDIGALEAGQYSASLQFDWANTIAYENGGMAVMSVTRTGDTSQAVAVSYSTGAGTATPGSDYTPATGVLLFQPGETRKTFEVFVANDGLNESIETVNLLLGNPQIVGDPTGMGSNTSLGLGAQSTATLSIVSDNVVKPGAFTLTSSVTQVNEGAGTATITVRRTDGSNGPASVNYSTGAWTAPRKPTWEMRHTSILYTVDNDQPATAGDDYSSVQGTLNFADGETEKTFTISLVDDAWYEGNEGLLVTLSNPTGGALLGKQTSAKVQIVENDTKQPGTFQFATDAYTVTEGTPTINVVVNRVGGSNVEASVRLYVNGAGNGSMGSAWQPSDFGSTPDVITFAPGETSKTISIPIVDDSNTEGTEAFSMQLYSPSNDASVGTPAKTTVSILDNESTLYFSSADGSTFQTSEGSGAMQVKVTRVGSTATPASFKLSTSAWGSATEGADFTPVSQTYSFAPGEASKIISIPIVNDTVMEAKESFGVSMSNVVGAQQGNWTWSAYINDDDVAASPGSLGLSSASYTVLENAGQLLVTVNRTGGSDGTVSVNYSTSDGATGYSSNQTAWAGSAYSSKSGTLTFAPGETTKTFAIPITDNTSVSSVDKVFTVKLSSPNGGATLAATTKAVVTIKDNDSAIRFVTSSYTGAEGSGVVQIQMIREGSTAGQAKIDLKLSSWGATPGQDYGGNAVNTIVFQDGESVKTFDLQIIDDVFKEPDEWLGLELTNAVGAQLGYSLYGNVKITDND